MGELITLKGGHKTRHRFLDRIPEWDERNSEYLIRGTTPALDVGVDLSRRHVWRLLRRQQLDQGQEGACVGFGWAHAAMCWPFGLWAITYDFARSMYHDAQQYHDRWPGGSYPGADPFYEGTSVLAGAKVARERGICTEYRWAEELGDAQAALFQHGPLVVGFTMFTQMMYPDQDGVIYARGVDEGGHCMAVIGSLPHPPRRSDVGPVAVLAQSWGLEHGHEGRVYLPWDDFGICLAANGEVCVPTRTAPKLPGLV